MSEYIKIVVLGDREFVTGSTSGFVGPYISGATNGLSVTGGKKKVGLGGVLTGSTLINSNNFPFILSTSGNSTTYNARLFLSGAGTSKSAILQTLGATGARADVRFGSGSNNVFYNFNAISGSTSKVISASLATPGIEITESGGKGLVYTANYSSTFGNRSVVDKGFVTGITDTLLTKSLFNSFTGTSGNGTITGGTNGLYVSGKNLALGGNVDQDTVISYNQNLTISGVSTVFGNNKLKLSHTITDASRTDSITLGDTFSTGLDIKSDGYVNLQSLGGIDLYVPDAIVNVHGDGGSAFNIESGIANVNFTVTDAVKIDAPLVTIGYTGAGSQYFLLSGNTNANNNIVTRGKLYIDGSNTRAGFNIGPRSTDPAVLQNGDLWYSTITNKFRGRANGVSVDLLNTTPFFTYTGTTAPASYLTKSVFAAYTGSTGGGGVTGATNGLRVTGKKIRLGGVLTGSTTIGLGTNNLIFTGTTGTIRYGSDLSANYNVRSVVDKGYVTGLTNTLLTKTAFTTYTGTSLQREITGTSYTVSSSDNGYTLYFSNVSGCLVRIGNLAVGKEFIGVRKEGAGTIIFTGISVSLKASGTQLTVDKSAASWIQKTSSEWYGFGALNTSNNFYVETTLFNSYTGSTAPAAFANKSRFNTFTGTTAPATYALKSVFNTYTGTTAPAAFVSKSLFNTYSGTTVPATYVSKSALNTYTGTTIPNTYSTKLIPFSTKTSNYTLQIGDADSFIEMSGGTSQTLTVPANSGVTFSIGTQIIVAQLSSNQLTINPGPGVTLRSNASKLKTTGQYSSLSLIKRNTNIWYVVGDTSL